MKLLGLVCLFFLGASATTVKGPLTSDFTNWLNNNGYHTSWFARTDLGPYGSYGGKTSSSEKASKQPLVLLHGSGDQALKYPGCFNYYCNKQTGWTSTISYFLNKGYTSASLYAFTWGPADYQQAGQQTHNCGYLVGVRKFLDAVLKYTGAAKIDVVGHGMGVTLLRKAILGGSLWDETGATCDLGSALTSKVDTFLAVAGMNYGMCNCQHAYNSEACNPTTGFYPGICTGQFICGISTSTTCTQSGYSRYLSDLNSGSKFEGSYRYSFYSTQDDLIGYSDDVWGNLTSRFPGMTKMKKYTNYNHMQTKDSTAADQYKALVSHSVSS
jgi:hypothetical protein